MFVDPACFRASASGCHFLCRKTVGIIARIAAESQLATCGQSQKSVMRHVGHKWPTPNGTERHRTARMRGKPSNSRSAAFRALGGAHRAVRRVQTPQSGLPVAPARVQHGTDGAAWQNVQTLAVSRRQQPAEARRPVGRALCAHAGSARTRARAYASARSRGRIVELIMLV